MTGWDQSLWEVLKAAERSSALYRLYNHRENLATAADDLPNRFFQPLQAGKLKGEKLDREQFRKMLRTYYHMMGWDPETGVPTSSGVGGDKRHGAVLRRQRALGRRRVGRRASLLTTFAGAGRQRGHGMAGAGCRASVAAAPSGGSLQLRARSRSRRRSSAVSDCRGRRVCW